MTRSLVHSISNTSSKYITAMLTVSISSMTHTALQPQKIKIHLKIRISPSFTGFDVCNRRSHLYHRLSQCRNVAVESAVRMLWVVGGRRGPLLHLRPPISTCTRLHYDRPEITFRLRSFARFMTSIQFMHAQGYECSIHKQPVDMRVKLCFQSNSGWKTSIIRMGV